MATGVEKIRALINNEDMAAALYASIQNFDACRPNKTVFINTIPKSGTLLLRNILAHFLKDKIKMQLVMFNNSMSYKDSPVQIGHLAFNDEHLEFVNNFDNMISLFREPCSLLLSLCRAGFDERSDRYDIVYIRDNINPIEYLEMIIDGYQIGGINFSPFENMISSFMSDWHDLDLIPIDHDELISRTSATIAIILKSMGVKIPSDFNQRIASGSRAELSATYIPPMHQDNKDTLLAEARRLIKKKCPHVFDMYDEMRERFLINFNTEIASFG